MGFQEKFWDPIWDRKINKKSIFGGKVGSTGGASIDFFALAAFVAFWVKFLFIFHEKSMKFEAICVASRCLFLNLATLMIYRILRCIMHFSIFRFLNIFPKKLESLRPKWNTGKASQKDP